jgi:hypothetical protein
MALFGTLSAAARGLPQDVAYISDYTKPELSAVTSVFSKPEHLPYASAYTKPVDYYVSWMDHMSVLTLIIQNLGIIIYYRTASVV